MKNLTGLKEILIREFNLCFFISLMLLSLHIETPWQQYWFTYIIQPTLNGILTAVIIIALNKYFRKKGYIRHYETANIGKLIIVAFSAGFLSLYITLINIGTYIISTFIIYIAIINIYRFAHKISRLLEPNTMATPDDLSEFAAFFINLIITFTVINLCANTVQTNFDLEPAFNFGHGLIAIIDAVYFSIITMTTVGYGQIVPHTAIARIIVSVECLTSYLMLGMMIGIINRGINFSSPNQNK